MTEGPIRDMWWLNETKGQLVRILVDEAPLSAREIFYRIKKEKSLSYQAVFKALGELRADGVLLKRDHSYTINSKWITELHDFIATYIKNEPRTVADMFLHKLGPQVLEHIGKRPACIIAVAPGGGGRVYGPPLTEYIKENGVDVRYTEINRRGEIVNPGIIKGRICILVDHATYTGTTYRTIMKRLRKVLTPEQLSTFCFAVEFDQAKLADFYISR